ncbi:MAG: 1,4-dihydroxy-6-naphthoate synthase [Bacteroidetes bacterium]|nr:MAG: 1,4-dihydroxy-6-naphthoate synthase [Bacteroidota bacterium]
MQLTLGFSPCPNDTFIFHAMLHGLVPSGDLHFNTVIEDVETLNEWAFDERLDVTKASFHTYLKVRDAYTLLDSGAALGFGCGPLLIARTQLSHAEIINGPIAIPGENTTAHMLFRLKYPDASNKKFVLFSDVEQAVIDGRAVAGVIIHENRFTYASKGLVEILDLGAYWESETGTPIPLGAILAKKSLGTEQTLKIERLIKSSVEHAFLHPEDSLSFTKKYASEMDPDVMLKHIKTYVNDFSISLQDSGMAAVRELEFRAKRAGII